MARITVEQLKEIYDTALEADVLTAFINIANIIVTNGPAASTKPSLSSSELADIERFVAAHLCCLRDPVALRSKLGDAESWLFPAAVTTAWSKGYGLTVYGQMAVSMDRTGRLAAAGQRRGSFRASPREDSVSFTSNLRKS